jgi:ferredoxin
VLHFPNPPTVFQHETDTFFLQLQRLADLATAGGAGDFKPYTGQPLSKFVGSDPSGERRAVFVNESACIGCRQCNHSAPKTFMMEDDWGRARAFAQWDDSEEDINIAIESCPVDCIYFVKQRNLPILEYAMQRCERQNVGLMNGGNSRVGDPFDVANGMLK